MSDQEAIGPRFLTQRNHGFVQTLTRFFLTFEAILQPSIQIIIARHLCQFAKPEDGIT